MSAIQVHAASDREQQVVIDVMTLAFSTDPMARWAYPNPQTYLAIWPEMIKAFGSDGFAHGTVHLVNGGGAAAMWLPPGVQPDSERLEALTGQHAPLERQADMAHVFEQMGKFHPEEPCWYLPLIGVDPTAQGRGYGSALLRYALEHVDRTGAPAYLESSNPRNVALYERHGFKILGRVQAGSSPTIVPMLRRPAL
jgi:ribosomal protein S18 acetylase RimI-like enzyme